MEPVNSSRCRKQTRHACDRSLTWLGHEIAKAILRKFVAGLSAIISKSGFKCQPKPKSFCCLKIPAVAFFLFKKKLTAFSSGKMHVAFFFFKEKLTPRAAARVASHFLFHEKFPEKFFSSVNYQIYTTIKNRQLFLQEKARRTFFLL